MQIRSKPISLGDTLPPIQGELNPTIIASIVMGSVVITKNDVTEIKVKNENNGCLMDKKVPKQSKPKIAKTKYGCHALKVSLKKPTKHS